MILVTETDRLIVRNFYADEEQAYLDLFNNPLVNQYLPSRTINQNRQIFIDTIAEYALGTPFSKWAIINKADGDFIGMGLLRSYNGEPDTLEVGYALHAKYWGRGMATELTKALITYAFSYPQIKTIVAVTTPNHIASQTVLQKSGLIRQGHIMRDGTALAFFKMAL